VTVVTGFEVLGEKEKCVASAGNRTTFIVRPAYRRLAISNAPSWLLCWLSLLFLVPLISLPGFDQTLYFLLQFILLRLLDGTSV
jgi:hypothetical protein